MFSHLLGFASALLVGFSKTGLPGVSIPGILLMAQAFPDDAKLSLGAILPVLLVGDVFAVAWYRHHAQWRRLLGLFPYVAAGMVPGVVVLLWIQGNQLRPVLGGVVLGLLVIEVWRRWRMGVRRKLLSAAEEADEAECCETELRPLMPPSRACRDCPVALSYSTLHAPREGRTDMQSVRPSHSTPHAPREGSFTDGLQIRRTYNASHASRESVACEEPHCPFDSSDSTPSTFTLGSEAPVILQLPIVHAASEATPPRPFSRQWFFMASMGLLAGFSTVIGNAAMPVATIYFLSRGLLKNDFIGTAAWFFFLINLSKLPICWWLGVITPRSIEFGLMVTPLTVVGAVLGVCFLSRIPQRLFDALALGLAGIAATWLIAEPLVAICRGA